MAKITFLGTASAVPNKDHHNSHLLVASDDRVILVDCPGNPIVRLDQAGIDPLSITDLILTHFHPDHVSGLPLLLMDLWLLKRKSPLTIYGLVDVLERCKKLMSLYDWQEWVGMYDIKFHAVANNDVSTLVDSKTIKVWSAPVQHLIPTIGIKMKFSEGSVCYSADTAPCETVVELAKGVDVLIHEATGHGNGHSSPAEAGIIARKAGVEKLYLIHYSPTSHPEDLIDRAKSQFPGEVILAKDLMTFTI